MNNVLVLFDIDETLIDSGRAGARALDRVFQVARRLSRMRESDVEDAEKN